MVSEVLQYDRVTVKVNGSTANLGPYFDKAGAAISDWSLDVSLEPVRGRDIDLVVESNIPVPKGRQRGYAGVAALEQYLHATGIKRGTKLTIKDTSKEGFPTGGTGSSGAESVGAVTAAAVLFGIVASPREIVLASAKGEPGEHKDNVAPSVLGGIVFLSEVPNSEELYFRRLTPPRNLGLAIGFSSHQKSGGTEQTRNCLEPPVDSKILKDEVGRAVAGALSLYSGYVDEFLKFVYGDLYHEPRRADAGQYGDFSAKEFSQLKCDLYKKYRIALAVSGAGPGMQFWYERNRYLRGLTTAAREFIEGWFAEKDISLCIKTVNIQRRGAFRYAQTAYPKSSLNLIHYTSLLD